MSRPEHFAPIAEWLVDQLRPVHLRKDPPMTTEIAPEDRAAWMACLAQLESADAQAEPDTDEGGQP